MIYERISPCRRIKMGKLADFISQAMERRYLSMREELAKRYHLDEPITNKTMETAGKTSIKPVSGLETLKAENP
jgi:hypothetical protein